MRARITDKANLLSLVDLLREEYEVIAPFYGRGRDTCFDTVTDANRHLVQVHIPNPYYPPKRYVLPHIERLLQIHLNDHPRIQATCEAPRRAIFGIRSCDIAGIYHLDRFYLGRDFKDTYYEQHRRNLFLVNVVCTDPDLDIDDDCFCMCADTGPAARDHFDLQLMDLGDEFLVVAGTDKGEALFAHPMFRKGTPTHLARRRQILDDVRKRFKTGDELVLVHRALHHLRAGQRRDLGADRQPLSGVRRLQLHVSDLHLLHRDGTPGRAGRLRARAPLGRLRLGRLHPHGRGLQPPQGRPRPPQSPILPEAGPLLHPAGTVGGLRGLRALRRGLSRGHRHAQRGGDRAPHHGGERAT